VREEIKRLRIGRKDREMGDEMKVGWNGNKGGWDEKGEE
jgi:hypothetical protein